jgi:hypothetical protein
VHLYKFFLVDRDGEAMTAAYIRFWHDAVSLVHGAVWLRRFPRQITKELTIQKQDIFFDCYDGLLMLTIVLNYHEATLSMTLPMVVNLIKPRL